MYSVSHAFRVVLFTLAASASIAGVIFPQTNSHLYVTGTTLEIDRCASAWLIKRFVDQEAIFRFVPDGELVTEGIAFDTADAKLTRTHNKSTFEVIADAYDISDQRVIQLAEIMHDIEINFWGAKQIEQSRRVEMEINQIISKSNNNKDCLERCFQYFDRWSENREE